MTGTPVPIQSIRRRVDSLEARLKKLKRFTSQLRSSGPFRNDEAETHVAKTAADTSYPSSPANVFGIIFQTVSFTRSEGNQTPTYTAHSASVQDFALSLEGYIEESTVVVVKRQRNGQYVIVNCLCSSTCSIGSDDFNRADSSSLGADWSEDAGSWSIASNKLSTSSASAKAVYQTAHPDSESQHVVDVIIAFSTVGDQARIWLGDKVYVQVEYQSAVVVKIYEDSGSGFAQIATTTCTGLASPFSVSAYMRDDLGIVGASLGVACCAEGTLSSAATQYKVGLGTGTNAGGITFDDFEYRKSRSTTNPDCETGICECSHCQEDTTPTSVSVTISGMTNGSCTCTGLNATHILQAEAPSTLRRCSWVKTGTLPSSCSDYLIRAEYTSSGGTATLRVTIQILDLNTLLVFDNATYTKTATAPMVCTGSHSLSYETQTISGGYCNNLTGLTVSVLAAN